MAAVEGAPEVACRQAGAHDLVALVNTGEDRCVDVRQTQQDKVGLARVRLGEVRWIACPLLRTWPLVVPLVTPRARIAPQICVSIQLRGITPHLDHPVCRFSSLESNSMLEIREFVSEHLCARRRVTNGRDAAWTAHHDVAALTTHVCLSHGVVIDQGKVACHATRSSSNVLFPCAARKLSWTGLGQLLCSPEVHSYISWEGGGEMYLYFIDNAMDTSPSSHSSSYQPLLSAVMASAQRMLPLVPPPQLPI